MKNHLYLLILLSLIFYASCNGTIIRRTITPITIPWAFPLMPDDIEYNQISKGFVWGRPIDEPEAFYLDEMEDLGWELIDPSTSETNTNSLGDPSISLDFERGDEEVNILLEYNKYNNATLVILYRRAPK